MKLLPAKNSCIQYLLLFALIFSASCEKNEEVEQKEFIRVTTFSEDLDKNSTTYNDITNFLINGASDFVAAKEDGGITFEASESVDYSFELVTTIITSNFVPVKSSVNYSGSIPKSMFTESGDGINRIKISVKGRVPTIYVNNVKIGNQSGTGDGGSGTGSTQELKRTRVEGNSGGKSYIEFSLPKNAATLTIKTAELSNADLNMADVFVSYNKTPTITSNYPYKFSADYSHTAGNRGEKIITIKNAQAGTWQIMLYGFNSYYWSWVIVTAQY